MGPVGPAYAPTVQYMHQHEDDKPHGHMIQMIYKYYINLKSRVYIYKTHETTMENPMAKLCLSRPLAATPTGVQR